MSDELIIKVAESLAAADNVDVEELDYRLQDDIDAIILEKLSETQKGIWNFTFQVSDHQVTITHKKEIFINGVQYNP